MTSLHSTITNLYDADFLDKLFRNYFVFAFLLILNLGGGIVGFYSFFLPVEWYPLDLYHPLFWFFIADCPVYAALFVIFLFKRDWEWLNGILFFHMIKYGLTGSLIWAIYLPHLVDLSTIPGFVGWGSHVFLVAEAVFILPFLKFTKRNSARRDLIIIIAWVIFNEIIDFLAFSALTILNLFTWSEQLGPAPPGTIALFPLVWTIMPDFLIIYVMMDVVLIGIIFWRYFKANHQEVAVL
ncbi:MAG: DUF1405 domain-containing protein [Candidatus Odinarchaeota archaeon]